MNRNIGFSPHGPNPRPVILLAGKGDGNEDENEDEPVKKRKKKNKRGRGISGTRENRNEDYVELIVNSTYINSRTQGIRKRMTSLIIQLQYFQQEVLVYHQFTHLPNTLIALSAAATISTTSAIPNSRTRSVWASGYGGFKLKQCISWEQLRGDP